jgi:hypothetical protein
MAIFPYNKKILVMDKAKYNRLFLYRIEISFIIILSLCIILFYFYPLFEPSFITSANDLTPDFVIVAIPMTIQKSERVLVKPILPGIPIESEDLEITTEVEIPTDTYEESADTLLVFYYPQLKYQHLFELLDANLLKALKSEDSLSQYREYLVKRFEKMDISKVSIFPSTAFERELNKSMGRLPIVGVSIPVNLGDLFGTASSHVYPNRISKRISVKNIIKMHKKFDILQSLWTYGPQSILELYAADSIGHKNTYATLQQSLDDLIINGLIEPTKTAGGEHKFKPVFSHKEMVRIVAKFRYNTPDVQKIDSDILTGVLQELLDFN